MTSATLMTKGVSPFAAVGITVFLCLLVGLLNGQLVAKCSLPPFIATLGTMTIARGIAQIVNNNHNTDSIGEGARAFRSLFYYGDFGGVYSPVWIAVALWLVFNFILSSTRTGRHIYAVGSNIDAARMSGVNVNYTVTVAYLVSAFCSCVAGLVTCAAGGIGTMDAGNMYELYAVAASVIGGVSTLGGQGLLLGTVVGASIWSVLQNGLILAGAPVAIRNIAVGIIVVISVLLDIVVRSGKRIRPKKTT
jgi:ribose transport system permease protein